MTGAFQLFPDLDAATEAALTESIRRFGVLVPVARDQHGRILDGYHRSRIATELGVDFRVDVHRVADDEEAREIAHTLNTDRRQLSVEQRREVVSALREQGHSLRAIAGAVGASVGAIRNDLSGVPSSTPAERTKGLDGKSYPARRSVVAAKSQAEATRAQTAIEAAGDAIPATVIDTKRAERLAREAGAARRRSEDIDPSTVTEDITILHGDFADVLAPYDLIGATVISDPPYPREHLPLWSLLAEHSLGWGCSRLVLMTGQSILPDVLDAVLASGDWRYRWCGAYLTPGPSTRVWGAKVGTSWKPILVFDRDNDDRPFVMRDVFTSSGDDKRHHHWGQNEEGIAQIVETFTSLGEMVVDPFLGGGTTAVVCRELGRRFVGCDIDADAVTAARARLA